MTLISLLRTEELKWGKEEEEDMLKVLIIAFNNAYFSLPINVSINPNKID